MIQRIQSIFLLLVAVLMGVTVTSPLLSFQDAHNNILLLESMGIYFESQQAYPTWGIISIAVLIAGIALVEIFSYKDRKKQMKMSAVNTILILLFYITVAVYTYFGQRTMGAVFYKVEYGIMLPFIALVFNVLAQVRIKKDEKLVRSLDRIR